MTFSTLFDTYVIAAAEHQEHAQEVIGDGAFSADLERGTLSLGPELIARAELIGTEATGPGSWLWSWANPSGYPDHVVRAARHAKDVGEQQGVPELTTAELPLDGSAIGYRCAVVACGLAGGYAFYPAKPGPGTTAYLLMDHPALALPPVRLPRTATVLTTIAGSGQVADWRRALDSYAELRGLAIRREERSVELTAGDQGTIRVTLDELGRVTGINFTLAGRR